MASNITTKTMTTYCHTTAFRLPGQTGYRIIPGRGQAAIRHALQRGTQLTFLQNPAYQFQTRYSRLVRAPEIKRVPVETVNKTLILKSPGGLSYGERTIRVRGSKEP
jgi:hypothetical protein